MKHLLWLLLVPTLSFAQLNVCPKMPTAAAVSHQWVKSILASGSTTQTQPDFTDLLGTATDAQLPSTMANKTFTGTTSFPGSTTISSTGFLGVGTATSISTPQEKLASSNVLTTDDGNGYNAVIGSTEQKTSSPTTGNGRGVRGVIARTITTNVVDVASLYGVGGLVILNTAGHTYTGGSILAGIESHPIEINGGGTAMVNLAGLYAQADTVTINGNKVGVYAGTPSGATAGNASIADNIAFSGSYFLNSTNTNPSLFSGALTATKFTGTATTGTSTFPTDVTLTDGNNDGSTDLNIQPASTGQSHINMGVSGTPTKGQIVYSDNVDSMWFRTNSATALTIASAGSLSTPSTLTTQSAGDPNTNSAGVTANGNVFAGVASTVQRYSSGRSYVVVKGNAGLGGLELSATQADADQTLQGSIQFVDSNSTAGDKGLALILGLTNGATANNRGGELDFRIKPNGSSGPTSRMTLTETGLTVVSLAGTGPRTVLADANGLLSAPVSDARLKKNIKPLPETINPIETVKKLKGVTFFWDTQNKRVAHFGDEQEIGFIAQDVEKVLPQVVRDNADGYKSMDYAKLVPLLVESVKVLEARIQKLEKAK